MKTNKKTLRVFVLLAVVGVLPLLSCRPPVTPESIEFTSLGKNAQGFEEFREEQTGIVFVKLPGGKFQMRSPASEAKPDGNEYPVHEVTLSPFLIAKYEVTQAQWKRVMGTSPSYFKGDELPVEKVSWNDCQEFCKNTGLSLPTEAQWEYACRAGTTTAYHSGASEADLAEVAWYNKNSGGTTHPVGTKKPNDFGLYDMHGNLWEWCEDEHSPDSYGPVSRGGSFSTDARICDSADRTRLPPDDRIGSWGFRPLRPLP